jgi:membrane protease YdiL (CAAX protease family)
VKGAARIGGRRRRSFRSAPCLGEAFRALAVVWTLLASEAFLAGWIGPSGATLSGFAAAVTWLVRTRPVAASAPRASRTWQLTLGAAAGYASLPAWWALCSFAVLGLGLPVGAPVPPGVAPPALLPALLLLGPVFEELLYRERLLGALAPRTPAPVALVVSSFAFALPHLEPRLVVATFLVGLVLGAVWLATRSLAVPPTRAALTPAAGAVCGCLLLGLAVFGGTRR